MRAVNTGAPLRAVRLCMSHGLTENEVMDNILDNKLRVAGLVLFYEIVLLGKYCNTRLFQIPKIA